MDYDVIYQEERLGELSIVKCDNAEEAHPNIFGSIPCGMEFFENQIPNFRYPIVILNIEMCIKRKGNGTMTMKQFHYWAQQNKIPFGILRIGIRGDNYETELDWKIKFYRRLGWKQLKTPTYEDLINPKMLDGAPTNDWMYCDFKDCSSYDFNIKFNPRKDLHLQVFFKQ